MLWSREANAHPKEFRCIFFNKHAAIGGMRNSKPIELLSMKKIALTTMIVLALVGLLLSRGVQGGEKQPATAANITTSAEKTSFAEVTSKLDGAEVCISISARNNG